MTYVFQFGFVWREFDLLLGGAWLTIKLSAGAMFFGLLVGIACAQAKTSRWPWLRAIVQGYVEAIRKAVEVKLTGAHVFGIANSISLMSRSNDELLDEVFPGTKRKRKLKPNESLISIEKAQRVLGYKPEHDWSPGNIRAPRLEKDPPRIVTEALAAKTIGSKARAPRIVKSPPKVVTGALGKRPGSKGKK